MAVAFLCDVTHTLKHPPCVGPCAACHCHCHAEEFETEQDGEEEEAGGQQSAELTDGEAAAAAPERHAGTLLSSLPPLSQHVLSQRQAQLVDALVSVLASELQQGPQALTLPSTQNQRPGPGANAEPAAAAAGLTWRSSLAVCSALVRLLTSAVSPEKPPPTYQLLLDKAATQEEFIPGQLPSGGVVSSAALAAAVGGGGGGEGSGGPLMRDVKNYVCMRLDMTGKGVTTPGEVCLNCERL
jgi:hypothetical protein